MTDEQFQALAAIGLKQIELLEHILAAVSVIEVEESNECQHPEDARVSFATPSQPDRWVCNAVLADGTMCRYEHHGIVRN